LVADFHNILNRWKKYFCHLLNKHGASDITQTEIHASEPLTHYPSPLEVEISINRMKRHKSPDIDQIPGSEIHKLINPIWNKEELPLKVDTEEKQR
jgi:hypothetical protein